MKLCPIPADIKVGDKLRLRDGQVRTVDRIGLNTLSVCGVDPGGFHYDGKCWFSVETPEYDCVAIIRQHPKPKKGERERVSKFAKWLSNYYYAKCPSAHATTYDNHMIQVCIRKLNNGKKLP